MNLFQNSYFDHSYLYPTQAFFVLALLYASIVIGITLIIIIGIKKREKILSAISKDPIFSILIVTMVIVGSRTIVMFFNSAHVQMLPEKMFAMDMVGRDWYDGVLQHVMRLWTSLPFNPLTGYGQGFTVLIGVLFYPLYALGIITQETVVHFSQISYIYFASFVSLSYMTLIATKFRKEIRNILIIVFITFLLGLPGSLGLERGNIDMLFSLVMVLLYFSRMSKHGSSKIFCCMEACILGMLTASKLTMLPISLAFILTSEKLFSSIIYFVISYSVFCLSPILFGVHSSLLDPYTTVAIVQRIFFSNTLSAGCWSGNYVLFGLAALFIACPPKEVTFFNNSFLPILYFVYAVLFVLVFIFPLVPLLGQLHILTDKIFISIKYIYQRRSKFVLLFLTLAIAAINLLPVFSFSYRLYFSFALLVTAWYSITNTKAKQLLLVSTLCLLLNGVWFPEWKLLTIFVTLHYLSLLYAVSLELRTTLSHRKDLYGGKKK